MSGVVSVAVDVPLLSALTYRVPEGLAEPPVGVRVIAPLGRRVVTGCVVPSLSNQGGSDHAASVRTSAKLRYLVKCLDVEPYLPREIVELALWVSDYYACGPGEAIAAAMPPLSMLKSRRGGQKSVFKTVRVAALTDLGRNVLFGRSPGKLGPRQRLGLRLLDTASDALELTVLATQGIGRETIERLSRRSLVSIYSKRIDRDPLARDRVVRDVLKGKSANEDRELTTGQERALSELTSLWSEHAFNVALLYGVTGSGKTEVYLRLAQEVSASGRGVLVLVPEIALTPAVTGTFQSIFGRRLAVQHSGLSDGERHDQWHRIRRGDVDVVVGTRSAVFAPIENLGLIVVDEEHDGSYKQEETPRYHARSVAVVRAQRAGALVVLGSATPSLESYQNVRAGRYRCVVMAERVGRRPMASVEVVDMRKEMAEEGADIVLSRVLREALSGVLGSGEQALILLNRRGYASAVLCRQCGRTLECPNCSVALTFHRAAGRARCHYCNYGVVNPSTCKHCAGPYLETVGFGTERIERDLVELFPAVTVGRLDRDTSRRRGSEAVLLARFRHGDIQVLVGTQMIAKGHDFPNVTLVGVVSADVGLTVPDFRAAERTFQLLTQVAGRAGRGDRLGHAIIQSYYPEHYSIAYACKQLYEPFFEREIRFRADLQYPPTLSIVNAVVRGRSHDAAMGDARELASTIRAHNTNFKVLGPAVAPISRIRGQYRAQVFLKGTHRRSMREALRMALANKPTLRRKVIIDVDPMTML